MEPLRDPSHIGALPGTSGVRRTSGSIDPVDAGERLRVLEWLDRGLRNGRQGRIEAEYPLALDPRRGAIQTLARVDDEFVAHALGYRIAVDLAGVPISVGLIGLVYTDPRWRGRGFASHCIRNCIAQLTDLGCSIIALWSDLDRLYQPLGFHEVGTEWILSVDAQQCRHTLGSVASGMQISRPLDADWKDLEILYRRHPYSVRRLPGDLQRLASIPDTRLHVIRRGGRPISYLCEGRGDDLQGYVHEWAGEAEGVLFGLADLANRTASLAWIVGSLRESPARELVEAGARCSKRPFAWALLPDLPGLWEQICRAAPGLRDLQLSALGDGFELRSARSRIGLTHSDAAELILGPRRPTEIARILSPREYLALRQRLPLPFFLSGLDSI